MYKSFFQTDNFNLKKFISYIPNKKNKILDYGCGNGIFSNKILKHKNIRSIKMMDRNKRLKLFIENKYYNNPKIEWTNSKDGYYDVVLINSVIQYLSLKEYKKLLNFFFKNKIKIILISDIPKFHRYIEAFLLLFLNPKKFIIGMSYLFKKNYLSTPYFYKKYKALILNNPNYDFKIQNNLNEDELLRYTLVIKNKL
jgi:2-polyprenyl-3-methyl-5-hydroxy-6-metoxy-1,4-benzoquinol methylase